MLLSDEPIFVQDDNYFHTPVTPLSPANGGSSKGESNAENANANDAGAGVNHVTTGIAAVGVSSVNSPTTGKICTSFN